MGQASSDGGGLKVTPQQPVTPGIHKSTSIVRPTGNSWDMNSTIASHVTSLVRGNSDHLSRTSSTVVPVSQSDKLWTWNVVHIAVVSSGVILLLLVIFALFIFVVYYRRVLKPRKANVSFGPSPPSYNRARSAIFNRFAAEEATRRNAAEALRKMRTPSPQSVGEDIPMTMLRDMQNNSPIEYNDNHRGNMGHQETEIDGVFHHSMPHLDTGDPQYNELPHHTMPLQRHHHRPHQVHSYPHQRYHHSQPHHPLRSDLNANITLPTRTSHFGHHSRKILDNQRIAHLHRRRGRLFSEPAAAPHRMCTCSLLRDRPEPRTLSGNRRTYGSYRPQKLPKFNLAGENIPSSSEPSLVSLTL